MYLRISTESETLEARSHVEFLGSEILLGSGELCDALCGGGLERRSRNILDRVLIAPSPPYAKLCTPILQGREGSVIDGLYTNLGIVTPDEA